MDLDSDEDDWNAEITDAVTVTAQDSRDDDWNSPIDGRLFAHVAVGQDLANPRQDDDGDDPNRDSDDDWNAAVDIEVGGHAIVDMQLCLPGPAVSREEPSSKRLRRLQRMPDTPFPATW